MIRQIDIDDRKAATVREVADALGFLKQTPKGKIVIRASNGEATIDSSVMKIFVDLVGALVQNNGTPETATELSPQEAAERLRISRPTVMRLIAEGKLGARQVGSHYRLSEAEVMDFKVHQGTIRRRGLDELSAFSQDFDQ